MRPLGVLLLLLTCQLATSIPISDRDAYGRCCYCAFLASYSIQMLVVDGADFHSGHQRYYRSAGVGETVRDWFKEIKNRIMGKWQEWFGNDGPTPSLLPQDFLNIDKAIEGRVSSYPGLFLDLSNLSFDPKRDWGIRIGNWYIIRKITGNEFKPDGNSDEWDIASLMPNLPFPSIPGIDWKPDKHGFGVTRSPTTTPKIESTTSRRQTTQTVTQSTIITTEPTTVTSAEPSTTQSIATSTEPTVISTEEIQISRETVEMNSEPVDSSASVESTLTSTETITISTGSTVPSNESTVISAEPSLTSTELTVTTNEPIITTESTVISTEEIVISTIESSATEPILPLFGKRIEENEIDKPTTKKPRPASAEVIMF